MTVFAIILGVVYFLVGAAKLAGAKPLAEQFDEFGLGSRGMRSVGALEVAAAVGLQIGAIELFAALGMVAMMVGALYHHRKFAHPPDALVPSLGVLVASAVFVVLSL